MAKERNASSAKENRVSIRDIAKALELHHTTVSLALRNSSLLKEGTKQKVREMAEKMGYRPDPMLSALTAYRQAKRPSSFHAVLGWINNWKEPKDLHRVPTYRAYLEGASQCAQRLGYVVEEFCMHERGMTPGRMQRILRARNVAGLLIPPQKTPGDRIDLDFTEVCAVAFGFSTQPSTMHLVTSRHDQIIDRILAELHKLGYRRPGFCIPPWSDPGSNFIWISKWQYQLTQYRGFGKIPRLKDRGREHLKQWLERYKPDVLVGFSDVLADLESLGFKVPEDIGFVSTAIDVDDPRISGINENDFLIGKTAVDLLVGMIQRGEKGLPQVPIRTLVDCDWFSGATLRNQNL